jgi:hypothetical protein
VNRFAALCIAIATGIARDRGQRRRTMFALTILTLVVFFIGVAFLWNIFPAHPLFFALYWLACGWLAICMCLLAIYDLLSVARQGRREREEMRRRIFRDD